MTLILGIETSCDDTSIALLESERRILTNRVQSQDEAHRPYSGVVPEIASRSHLANIRGVYRAALEEAGARLNDVTAIAVTAGPGLMGSLMVGVNFAKGLALGSGKPLIAVNHIRGHVAAVFLEHEGIALPALALIVSGGHTHLFRVNSDRTLDLVAKTRDDAAGEAFDKLSKMLGLGFPGGPVIDRLARGADAQAFPFVQPKFSDGSHDYSFSGMKTQALKHLEKDPERFHARRAKADLCASFQRAAVQHLVDPLVHAVKHIQPKPRSLLLGGGVACNSHLRARFGDLARQLDLPAYLSSPALSTDNGAMIAAEGRLGYLAGSRADLDLEPNISWPAYREYLARKR